MFMKKDKKNNTDTENTGENNSGNRNSGDWNSGNRNSGSWNSGYGNSGDRNSGYGNSGNRNSGDWNSGNRNSGDWNSGDGNSGNRNSGDGNSGYGNSGNWNSGYGNSTERSSGIFCNSKPLIICFNKNSGKTWDEIDHPHFIEFYLTKWIPENKMTDEEKKADPEFYVRGGYLKKYEYKEAWQNFWRDTNEENKKKFLALPNFDSKIFYEITGIRVEDNSKKQELLNKADELIAKANELKEQANNL